jgi:hypothetical protein
MSSLFVKITRGSPSVVYRTRFQAPPLPVAILQPPKLSWYHERRFRLKIPGVATHERGQQERAPNRSGGRAVRDDLVPGYTAGVSPALLSTASSLSAAILHHGLGSQRAVRRETPVSPACSPPKRRGDSHPSGKRTWISFTCGLGAPKRHDLVSLAPPSSMPHIFICFHVWYRHRASQPPTSRANVPGTA